MVVNPHVEIGTGRGRVMLVGTATIGKPIVALGIKHKGPRVPGAS